MPLFRVQGLTKRVGTLTILNDVSFDLEPGQSLGIMGKNGAGKTTLLKLLSLTSRASEGKIYWEDQDVMRAPDTYRKNIGAVFHHVHLYGDLTALQNLRFYAGMFQLNGVENDMEAWLHKTGLDRRRNDLVRTFSRGMQQRLSIARALLHRPRVLLLDEPLTGLDENGRGLFDNTLQEFRSRGGMTVMVAHAWDQVRSHADLLMVLERGKVLSMQDNADVNPDKLHQVLSR